MKNQENNHSNVEPASPSLPNAMGTNSPSDVGGSPRGDVAATTAENPVEGATLNTAPNERDATGPPSTPNPSCAEVPPFQGHRQAAQFWFDFGLNVVPIAPGTKIPVVKWDPWLTGLSHSQIDAHWQRHPDHDVGFIVGDNIIVFDADSPEALAALVDAEARAGVAPQLVVQTTRGQHHYFRRDPALPARLSAQDFPKKLDVKTGRAMVVLPPSAGKSILQMGGVAMITHANQLSVANPKLLDALKSPSRQEPTQIPPSPAPMASTMPGATLEQLRAGVTLLDPDMPQPDWFRVAAVVSRETSGSHAGYVVFDRWSSAGSKYKGQRETERVWKSLRANCARPATLGSLIYMLREAGHNWSDICAAVEVASDAAGGEGA